MAAGIVALGALLVTGAAGAGRWARRPPAPAAIALALGGLATVATGLLPIDCSEATDAACLARSRAGELSWHDGAHNLAAVAAALCLVAAPLLVALGSRDGTWRAISVATAALTAALLWVYLAAPASAYTGVVERALATVPLLWVATAALGGGRRREPPSGGGLRTATGRRRWTIQTFGSRYTPRSVARSMATGASASGTMYAPLSGSRRPVQPSRSATVPVIRTHPRTGVARTPPARRWTRIQGSKGSPRGSVQAA